MLAFAAWVWLASPFADAIRVDSIVQFGLRMRTAFEGGPPFDLAPLLTLAAVATAFGGLCRVLRGLWEFAIGGPERAPVGPPAAAPAA